MIGRKVILLLTMFPPGLEGDCAVGGCVPRNGKARNSSAPREVNILASYIRASLLIPLDSRLCFRSKEESIQVIVRRAVQRFPFSTGTINHVRGLVRRCAVRTTFPVRPGSDPGDFATVMDMHTSYQRSKLFAIMDNVASISQLKINRLGLFAQWTMRGKNDECPHRSFCHS